MTSGFTVPSLGVFAAIFDERGRILCVRLNYASKGWTTPGGRVERGESPLGALVREVREEVGLEVEPGDLLGVYAKPLKDDVVLSLRVRVTAQHPWHPTEEIAEFGYFGPDELPEPMSDVARARIMDAFAPASITCPHCSTEQLQPVRPLMTLTAVCNACGKGLNEIREDMRRGFDEWASFLGRVELVMTLEDRFKCTISDDELEATDTVDAYVDLLQTKVSGLAEAEIRSAIDAALHALKPGLTVPIQRTQSLRTVLSEYGSADV